MSEFYKQTGEAFAADRPAPKVRLDKDYEDVLRETAQPVQAEIVYSPDIPDGGTNINDGVGGQYANNGYPQNSGYIPNGGGYYGGMSGQGGYPGQGNAFQNRTMGSDRTVPSTNNYGGYPDSSQYTGQQYGGQQYQQPQRGAATAYYEQPFPDVRVDRQNMCPSCGNSVAEGTRYCTRCGTDLINFSNQRMAQDQRNNATQQGTANTANSFNTTNIYYNVGNSNINNNVTNILRPGARNKWVGFFLTFILGVIGGHCFYEGKIGKGIAYLFTGGIFGIGWLIDLIIAFSRLFTKDEYYYP